MSKFGKNRKLAHEVDLSKISVNNSNGKRQN